MLQYVGPDGQLVDERAALSTSGALRDGFSVRKPVLFLDGATSAEGMRDQARRDMIAGLTDGRSLVDEQLAREARTHRDSQPAPRPYTAAEVARNDAYAEMVRGINQGMYR